MVVRTLSMEEFLRDPSLADGKEPVALTQEGRTVKILVEPDRLVEAADAQREAQDLAAVMEGIADFEAGRVYTVDQVFEPLLKKYGV